MNRQVLTLFQFIDEKNQKIIKKCVAGFEAKQTSFNVDLVTYIDYEEYLKNYGQRFRRQTTNTISNGRASVGIHNFVYPNFSSFGFESRPIEYHERYQEPVCPVNEVYQACGSKCILGCRYANTTAAITISHEECGKSYCLAGCFCETGLVRHQSKCIPASECPIQKCQQNEKYVSFKMD